MRAGAARRCDVSAREHSCAPGERERGRMDQSCGGCWDEYTARRAAEAEQERAAADARRAVEEAREAAAWHADLRLRFALALAPAFPDLALASARAHNLRGDDFSPVTSLGSAHGVLQVFDLADKLAAEHERRCAEEAKVLR